LLSLVLHLGPGGELPRAILVDDLVREDAFLALVVPLGDPVVGAQRGEDLLEVVARLVVVSPERGAAVEVYVALPAVLGLVLVRVSGVEGGGEGQVVGGLEVDGPLHLLHHPLVFVLHVASLPRSRDDFLDCVCLQF